MDLLGNAAKWLCNQSEKILSVPVSYIPKNGDALFVKATLGRTLFRAENEYGMIVRIESRDFLVPVSQLSAEPQRGDSFIYDGKEYEVLAPNSEPVWRWSGPQHLIRRIHTKEIGNA